MNSIITNDGIARRLKYMHNTIECGFHSGFPPCCIKYYVTTWMWLVKDEPTKKEYWDLIRSKSFEDNKNYGYIPCPQCLMSGNIVEVKECPDGCPRRCYEEQAYDADHVIVGIDVNNKPLLIQL